MGMSSLEFQTGVFSSHTQRCPEWNLELSAFQAGVQLQPLSSSFIRFLIVIDRAGLLGADIVADEMYCSSIQSKAYSTAKGTSEYI